MNDELPHGWTNCPVEKIFRSFGGGTPNRSTPAYWKGSIPWLSSGDIKTERIRTATEFITRAGLENSSANLCRPGSVLVVVRSGILKHTLPVAVLEREAAINQDIKCFDSGCSELNEWLSLALRASANNILTLNREGTTVQSVKYETLKEFDLSVPPLAEQKRIVAKLEKLLRQVDSCQHRLAKIPSLLKRFRQSALAAACSGRLTADWREENPTEKTAARIIDESVRRRSQASTRTPLQRETFNDDRNDPGTVPQTWARAPVGKLFQVHGGGTPDRGNAAFWNGNIPWLSSGDIKSALISTSSEMITKRGLDESGARLCRKGAVLVVVRSGILKHTLPVAVLERDAAINQDIKAFDSGNDQLNAWLALAWQASAHDLLAENREGTTVQSVKLETLQNFELSIPPLDEQQEIVRRVEKLFTLAGRIEARFVEGRKRVDSITQAILAKAFRGELVPTEFELAKAEGRSFESAEELLERIASNGKPGRKEAKDSRH